MQRLACFLAMAQILACGGGSNGGGSTGGGSTNCADRNGTYLVHYVQKSGDCPTPSDQTISLTPGPPGVADGCTSGLVVTSDNCVVHGPVTCSSSGGPTYFNDYITWAQDANSASGDVTIQLADTNNNVLCTGSYTISYRRQ